MQSNESMLLSLSKERKEDCVDFSLNSMLRFSLSNTYWVKTMSEWFTDIFDMHQSSAVSPIELLAHLWQMHQDPGVAANQLPTQTNQ